MGEFTHGFCGCFDNFGVCVLTFFAPCYTIGKTAEALGDNCLYCGLLYLLLPCIVGGTLRTRIRDRKNINGSALGDYLAHLFCPLCATVQDHREIAYVQVAAGLSMARE